MDNENPFQLPDRTFVPKPAVGSVVITTVWFTVSAVMVINWSSDMPAVSATALLPQPRPPFPWSPIMVVALIGLASLLLWCWFNRNGPRLGAMQHPDDFQLTIRAKGHTGAEDSVDLTKSAIKDSEKMNLDHLKTLRANSPCSNRDDTRYC
jgi:hypothetical protein